MYWYCSVRAVRILYSSVSSYKHSLHSLCTAAPRHSVSPVDPPDAHIQHTRTLIKASAPLGRPFERHHFGRFRIKLRLNTL